MIGRGSLELVVSIALSSFRFSGGVAMGVGNAGEYDVPDCCLGGEEKRDRRPVLFIVGAV
jgi:hypothetical protein